MADNGENRTRRLARNVLILNARSVVTTIMGIIGTSLCLRAMGVENYGVYAALWSLVSLLGFIDTALRSAAERYLAVTIANPDNTLLHSTFHSIRRAILRLTLLTALVAEGIGVPVVLFALQLPTNESYSVMVAYQLALFTLLAGLIAIPYHSLLVATERMGIIARVQIVMAAYTLAGIACLPLFADTLVAYAALIASAAIITNGAWWVAARKRVLSGVPDDTAPQFLRFTLWNGLGEASVTVSQQGINLLLNLFFGPAANAARSIATQIQTFAAKLYDNYRLPVSPQLMVAYTEMSPGGFAESRAARLLHIGSLTGTALMIAFGVPVCFACGGLLRLWLGGDVPPDAVVFSWLLIISMIIDAMSHLAVVLIKTTGRVKRYYRTSSLLLLCALPVAALLLWAGAPAWGAPACLVGSQCALTAYRAAYLHTIGIHTRFVRNILLPTLLGVLSAAVVCAAVTTLLPPADALGTIAATLLCMALSGAVVYLIMVPRTAKRHLIKLLRP